MFPIPLLPHWRGWTILEWFLHYLALGALSSVWRCTYSFGEFPTIQCWLSFVETKSQDDMLVRWGGKWSFLGDWLWPDAWSERSAMEKQGKALGDTRETLFFNNCHWIYSLETAAQIAECWVMKRQLPPIGTGRQKYVRLSMLLSSIRKIIAT